MSSTAGAQEAGVNPKLPTWSGEWKTYPDYRLAVELEADGHKPEDLPYLAPRLVRNLTGHAWDACAEIDREQLRKETGVQYLLKFLREKRGRQDVDVLGEALGRYFQSGEGVRREGENLSDYALRHAMLLREMTKALAEVGTSSKVPPEIFGWFVMNQFIRLDPSDVATIKAQTSSYRLEDVMKSLQKMWGGDSLVEKDLERKRRGGHTKTYLVNLDEDSEGATGESMAWMNASPEPEETQDTEDLEESQAWFDSALAAYIENPEDGEINATFKKPDSASTKMPGAVWIVPK